MVVDRPMQLEILRYLRDRFPEDGDEVQSVVLRAPDSIGNMHVGGQMEYLRQHGLVTFDSSVTLHSGWINPYDVAITHRGIDFIEDDGGLSAILGVVTVRLHDDTIKQLLAARINASALPAETKKRWTDRIREMGSKSIERVVNEWVEKGVDAAIEHGPAALDALESLVFGG